MRGLCEQDTSIVRLTLKGVGDPQLLRRPVDVILVNDRSESMGLENGSPIAEAKKAAKTFAGLLSEDDAIGLVSYSSDVKLESPLGAATDLKRSSLNESINNLTTGGKTATGDAIHLANVELDAHENLSRSRTEILLTDGECNEGLWDVRRATREAAERGIKIYTVGLGPDVDSRTLNEIAEDTGGKYYEAANSTDLSRIYSEIATEIMNAAGRDVVVTEVLPDYIKYERSIKTSPDRGYPKARSDGTTVIRWTLGAIGIDECEDLVFEVSFEESGFLNVSSPDSKVEYLDWKGDLVAAEMPSLKLEVRTPEASVSGVTEDLRDLAPGDYILASLELSDLPQELEFNRDFVPEGLLEYEWGICINSDNNSDTGDLLGADIEIAAMNHKTQSHSGPYNASITDGTQQVVLLLEGVRKNTKNNFPVKCHTNYEDKIITFIAIKSEELRFVDEDDSFYFVTTYCDYVDYYGQYHPTQLRDDTKICDVGNAVDDPEGDVSSGIRLHPDQSANPYDFMGKLRANIDPNDLIYVEENTSCGFIDIVKGSLKVVHV